MASGGSIGLDARRFRSPSQSFVSSLPPNVGFGAGPLYQRLEVAGAKRLRVRVEVLIASEEATGANIFTLMSADDLSGPGTLIRLFTETQGPRVYVLEEEPTISSTPTNVLKESFPAGVWVELKLQLDFVMKTIAVQVGERGNTVQLTKNLGYSRAFVIPGIFYSLTTGKAWEVLYDNVRIDLDR